MMDDQIELTQGEQLEEEGARHREDQRTLVTRRDEEIAKSKRDNDLATRNHENYEFRREPTNDPFREMTEQSRRIDQERRDREERDRRNRERQQQRQVQQNEQRKAQREIEQRPKTDINLEHRDAHNEREDRGIAEESFRLNDRDYTRYYDAGDIEERHEQVEVLCRGSDQQRASDLEVALARASLEREISRDDERGLFHSR
jgi:hypothetical protein